MKLNIVIRLGFLLLIGIFSSASVADSILTMPGLDISLDGGVGVDDLSTPIKVAIGLTLLSLSPAILIMMTSFTRIVIVLSLLRHALGMQQTPPNTVIVSLAIFLTVFTMLPVINKVKSLAYLPYVEKQIALSDAVDLAKNPIRAFMVKHTREQDLLLMLEMSNTERPKNIEDINFTNLIPAFVISELKSAFQIGFIIFLPFLLIDIIVASVLMSMGMLMVPPMMISLPIKILMFVLIDGWNLVVRSLVGSFM